MNRQETEETIRRFQRELEEIKKKNKEEFRFRFLQNNFGENGFYTRLNRGGV